MLAMSAPCYDAYRISVLYVHFMTVDLVLNTVM